jgi:hypothetical protein
MPLRGICMDKTRSILDEIIDDNSTSEDLTCPWNSGIALPLPDDH